MLKEEIVQVLLKSVNIYKDYIVKGSISIEDRLEKEKLIDKLSLEHASLKEELESGDYAEGYTSLDDIDEEEKSISKKLQEKTKEIVALKAKFRTSANSSPLIKRYPLKNSRDIPVKELVASLKTSVYIEDIDILIKKLAKLEVKLDESGRPSMLATIKYIKEVDKESFNDLVIFSLVPRSEWRSRSGGKKSASELPAFAAFTPILLVAHLDKYSFGDWDTENNSAHASALFIALGFILGMQVIYRTITPPVLDEQVRNTYHNTVGTGHKNKEMAANCNAYTVEDNRLSCQPTLILDNLNFLETKFRLDTQTWIAHQHIRKPDRMILDIYDWDNVPKPLQEGKIVITEESIIKYIEDL